MALRLVRRLLYLIRQRRLDADLAEEMDFHRAMKQREFEERGVGPIEAKFATNRALGSVPLAQDQARDVWLPQGLQGVGQDLRLAVRALSATPTVTTVAVLSIAFGIGANTAIFSLANALLFRPLPVTDPQRLARLTTPPAVPGMPPGWFSYATVREIRRYGRDLFDGVLGYECCGVAVVTIAGQNQEFQRQFVTDDFFTTLGVQAFRGRVLQPGDDDPRVLDGPVAVMSYRAWQRRFGGRDDVIGARLTIDSVPITIIGVTPPDFLGLEIGHEIELSIPERWTATLTRTPIDEDTDWLTVMVQLKPGVSTATATVALRNLQPQIRAASFPKKPPLNNRWLSGPLTLEPAGTGLSSLRERFATPLLVLFAVVLLVLLMACANITTVLLARGLARRRELSVRFSLGASRWRLARQLLVESLVLSAAGTVLALVLAVWASRVLVASLSTTKQPILLDLSVDWHVLLLMATLTLATTVLFGLTPALRASRVAPIEALKAHGRGGEPDETMVRSGLLVAQVALSVVLVFTAGLCVRTFERLGQVPLGFDRDHVLVMRVNTHAIPFGDRLVAWQRLVDAAATVPGVVTAGGALNPPIAGTLHGISANFVVSEPGTDPPQNAEVVPAFDAITPRWLAASGVPLLLGRDVDVHDTALAPRVMLVNEAFVRRFIRDGPAMDRVLTVTSRTRDGDYRWGDKSIIGVVADGIQGSLREASRPMMYVPLTQLADLPTPLSDLYLTLRTRTEPTATMTRRAVAALSTVNPELSFTVAPMAQYVDESLALERVTAMVSGSFGCLALLLAAVGLYGVTAYAVTRRRSELGIRMALGAEPASVVRLVLSRVSWLVGLGVIIGAGASLWLSQYVASLLYGVEPRDPVTLVGTIIVLATVAAVAGWVPAWRATKVDPLVALRYD